MAEPGAGAGSAVACTSSSRRYGKPESGTSDVMEIMFSHQLDIRGNRSLLVEAWSTRE